MAGPQEDMTTVLVADHRAVDGVFEELERGGQAPQQRRDLVDHVIAELVKHTIAEEQYLYPAAREWLPDGGDLADHEISEHAEAEQLMNDLIERDPEDPQFEQKLSTLIRSIRHHVQDEEGDLFPKLRDSGHPQELVELGDKIVQAKQVAPTRPHPSAPNTPPANKILAPGAGLVDRIRDAMQGRST